MNLPRWVWLLALLLALAWCQHAQRPLTHPPGVLVADAPLQQALDAPVASLHKGDATITPLARFSLSARVLSRADYHWDAGANIAPVDLAVGWGRMSDSAILDKMKLSQSGRFFHWQVQEFPIPEREIIESAANMHLIPANAIIAREIKRTRAGDVVSLDGYLVQVDGPGGYKWVSSLTRSDTGAGACELVWVEHFDIAPRR